jgi:hypothetical protein
MQEGNAMNIEELEAEVNLATRRVREAFEALRNARQRLQDAVNEQSGLIGHVLEFTRRRGFGRTGKVETLRILVDRVGPYWGRELYAFGRRIIAHGSVGQTRTQVSIAEAKDLGRYIDPKSKDAEGRIIAETLQRGE